MKPQNHLISLLSLFGFCNAALAQQAGTLDFTFNPGSGANATVLCAALQTNGQILIGGYFTTFNGANRHYVTRLNPDGTLDSSFDPGVGPNGSVNNLAVQDDGKILIQGSFDSINGLGYSSYARLRPDGSVDTGFIYLLGAVRAVAVQKDGKIIVNGYYPATSSPQTNCIARVTTTGSLDNTFKFAGFTAGDSASAFGFQSDGRIIVGGGFTKINGLALNYLARLNPDGSLDTNFNAGIAGAGATSVFCLAVTPQDQIVVGGNFNSINGYSRSGIARLNADGGVDTTFDPGLGAGSVSGIALQNDGKIVIGGGFTTVNGTNRYGVARLNNDGSLDLSFNALMSGGSVTCTTVQPDGKTIVGCAGGLFNGIQMNGIARLNADNSSTNIFQFLTANRYLGAYLQGVVSNLYRIEWTTNINTSSLWTPLFDLTLQTNPQLIFDPAPIGGPPRFYRAVALP
jgi:uncharacterized delta-60 repeat protein